MILVPYRVAPSAIPGAGLGVFVDTAVHGGRVLAAPVAIERIWQRAEFAARPDAPAIAPSIARWFEDRYTVGLEWPDDCYLNHAFEPSGIWHLGFVFAARDLAAGEELTVDYRHLLAEGERERFDDALSGRPIVGLAWTDSVRLSLAQLARALGHAGG